MQRHDRTYTTFLNAFIAAVGGLVLACDASDLEQVDLAEAAGVAARPGDDDTELRALAEKYLFKEVGDTEARAIHEQIRRLSLNDADTFHRIVGELGGLEGVEREIFEASHELARSRGISFVDVSEHEQLAVLSELTGLPRESIEVAGPTNLVIDDTTEPSPVCVWPWASCSYTTQWNKTLAGFSCLSGCTVGAASDRVSNSACELGGCDYRMRFPDGTTANIDGKTAAADCVVNYYGGLIAYSTGSSTYVLSGVQGPSSCGLPTASIHKYFQVA